MDLFDAKFSVSKDNIEITLSIICKLVNSYALFKIYMEDNGSKWAWKWVGGRTE